MARAPRDLTPRFSIGEWFGHSLVKLSAKDRKYYAEQCLLPKTKRDRQPCPFQATKKHPACTKDGGVCSLRLYSHAVNEMTGAVAGKTVDAPQGELRVTCPYRFHEDLSVFHWVGETILGDDDPCLVGEVGFLEAGASTDSDGGDDVGRIDMVLVSNKTVAGAPMDWCALEIQAVYFSGNAMKVEFEATRNALGNVVFPAGRRRPDYRSSGPKRLMPQLQIKVPTLRRWGKKMACVVDRAFFDSLGEMDHASHASLADIIWFIVRFEDVPDSTQTRMIRDEIRYTTLERAVEGLTGGKPVPLPTFEARIAAKIGFGGTELTLDDVESESSP